MDTVDKVLIVIIVVLFSSTSAIIAHDAAQRKVREQAVVRGYASWKVSDDGTNATFEWKK